MRAVWQTEDVPESVAQRLLAKAEGNPFFLEELSWSVRERPDLLPVLSIRTPYRTSSWPESAGFQPMSAPSSDGVRDRSDPCRGTLLQALAASTALDAPLSRLMQLEFLSEQRTADGPTVVFKHALTQEVAYHSLDVSRRRQLHRQLGLAIETLYADQSLARRKSSAIIFRARRYGTGPSGTSGKRRNVRPAPWQLGRRWPCMTAYWRPRRTWIRSLTSGHVWRSIVPERISCSSWVTSPGRGRSARVSSPWPESLGIRWSRAMR